MRHSIRRLGLSFTEVKVIPFAHEIVPPEDDPKALDRIEGPIVVIGGLSLAKAALAKGWKPGAWADPNTFQFDVQRNHYGEHMFNHQATVCKLKHITKRWDRFFIRPNSDSKSFTGELNTWDEFCIWRQQIQALGECWGKTVNMNDLVVMAPVQEIAAEYRLFVVDGKVVTGSRYKMGTNVIYDRLVDDDVLKFADKIIRLFSPADAFALDIATTPAGDHKVLEINSLNSAGLYDADTMLLVHALNELADRV